MCPEFATLPRKVLAVSSGTLPFFGVLLWYYWHSEQSVTFFQTCVYINLSVLLSYESQVKYVKKDTSDIAKVN